ncbi:hypothetical protein EHF33_03935 [Deinococcus psychrotolerans]|uniref:Uncharacterized protein n=1 Tax=Deinococcus psychrotolerans TaxID=2489213 RepID=A0A3G8YLL1_9DEIO|nr:hypothetical protein [Deinococcus psychrotolerans]AZI42006.1 hypothetical protein EHF33_03935 [Deinococcus psychrotolerans]
MKRHLLSAALVAGLSLAAATNAPKLSLEQQAVRADVIVRATVEASSSVQESGQTWTVYPLTILETVAGDAQSLPQYQNKPSLWVLSGVQDAPVLPSGDSMLLLYKERYDSPLVGFNQGKYTLQSAGGAAAKVVTGLPDGTPGVTSSIPAVGANPLSTPPAATTASTGAAPNTNAPVPVAASAAPAVVDPAVPTVVAPAAPTPPAPTSAGPAASAQGDSLQASASASPSAVAPSASAPASDPAPSSAAATPPIVPTVSEASATASAGSATASAPNTAPAGQAPASPAAPSAAATPSIPTPPVAEAKTTDSTPVPAPNNPAPNSPAPTPSTAAPAVPNVAAPLQPGQMTLEAFRKLVLEARAKVGK